MRSLQQVVREEGLSGSVSLLSLARRYNVASLTALIAAHDQARRTSA